MKEHEIALWSAVASFFGSLLAIGIIDLINTHDWLNFFGAFLVAFITGGSVYAKGRVDDAKKKELRNQPTTYQKIQEDINDDVTKRRKQY